MNDASKHRRCQAHSERKLCPDFPWSAFNQLERTLWPDIVNQPRLVRANQDTVLQVRPVGFSILWCVLIVIDGTDNSARASFPKLYLVTYHYLFAIRIVH